MSNLRATKLTANDSTTITITFTVSLDPNIGVSNISIIGAGNNQFPLIVRSVSVSKWTLTINTQPMISGALYELILSSTDSQPFKGLHGERLVEDGATNHFFFVGIGEDSDTLSSMKSNLTSIWNPNSGTIVHDLLNPTAEEIEDAKHSVGEVGSSNYISVPVVDEEKTRGTGPYDRLLNEGAFKLLRVGSSLTSANINGTIQYISFPSDPISLQQTSVTREIVSNAAGSGNGFDGLLISVSKGPVIGVSSVVLIHGLIRYTYDLDAYRYGIEESKYDSLNAYPALDIAENQIRLSNAAVGPSFPLPEGSDSIEIAYMYKKLGLIPSEESVAVTATVFVPRENAPAVATSFFLNHAPITDLDGNAVVLNGVQWLNPAANFDPSVKHPAFMTEIPYSESSLPSRPGEFAVNYQNGHVVVFGVDGTGTDGTTVTPPVATYWFERVFQNGLDYNLFSDLWEIAAVTGRDLIGSTATISFLYENTFAEGTDFIFSSHVEQIDERVNNRLIGNFGLTTSHSPVNEVFRIYNETTGEVYRVSRISGNQVFFDASNFPVLVSVNREPALFGQQTQSQIVVSEEVVIPSKTFIAFKVDLQNENIASATGDFVGASFNSSLVFSDAYTFVEELYFDPNSTEAENLSRIQQVGDYMVDYSNGIAYVAVNSGSSTDIGDASYLFGTVYPYNKHIVEVANLYRSANTRSDNVVTFEVGTIGDETVGIQDLERVGETEVDGNPIVVVETATNKTLEVSNDALRVRHIFQVTDLQLSVNPVDFAAGSEISSAQPTTIILDPDGVPVIDLGDGTGLEIQAGVRKFVTVSRLSNIVSEAIQLAELFNDVLDPSFLQKEYWLTDVDTGENYFLLGNDGYISASENKIYLPNGAPDSLIGKKVEARYRAILLGGAAVLVDYTPGDIFIDYTYVRDELLISYEYGDNVLDWSISDTLETGATYYVSYRYGALRDALRDNFGILTGIDELAVAPLNLDRELYRSGLAGSLQSFLTGPTIPAIKNLVKAFTAINPNIEESVFFEWILGRDYLNLLPMVAKGPSATEAPIFAPGKFGYGILLNQDGQTATLPATSNMRFAEGTWECQFVPLWMGIDNDASLTFDVLFDGCREESKIFIGSSSYNPESIPFTLDRFDSTVLGMPLNIHSDNGCFIWYDSTAKKWRLRARAPIDELRTLTGTITSSGQFGDVVFASSVDGRIDYFGGHVIGSIADVDGNVADFTWVFAIADLTTPTIISLDATDLGSGINIATLNLSVENIVAVLNGVQQAGFVLTTTPITDGYNFSIICTAPFPWSDGYVDDFVRSTSDSIEFSFLLSSWDVMESDGTSYAAFDGIDFRSDNVRYIFDTGVEESKNRMSLYKDGSGFLRYRVYDSNGRLKIISANIRDWEVGDIHPIAVSWKVGTIEQRDELHLFLDGVEVPNTYRFSGYLAVPSTGGVKFMDTAGETLLSSATKATFGGRDMVTISGSSYVYSDSATFVSDGIVAGAQFTILDTTQDGINTQAPPYVFVSEVTDEHTLKLEIGPAGPPYLCVSSLSSVQYSVNRLRLATVSDPQIEKVRIYSVTPSGEETELRSPNALYPDYSFDRDGYQDYIIIDNGVPIGNNVILYSYGLTQQRNKQSAYIWPYRLTNILKTIMQQPTAVSKIRITNIITPRVLVSSSPYSLSFCQPSNLVDGRRISARITGDNFDFTSTNKITIDGYVDTGTIIPYSENIIFTEATSESTTHFFTLITGITATFTPIDGSRAAGAVEIRETLPLTQSENGGDYAIVRLSVIEQTGLNGVLVTGPNTFSDAYARFGAEDIGKYIYISTPLGGGSQIFTITDVELDPSATVKDSNTVVLSGTFPSATDLQWSMLSTSYSDSGFANGLITLEIAGSGGLPFLLNNCWYEIDFPGYAVIPFDEVPETLYIGSNMDGENQANGVIDELHILNEMLTDTGAGEILPSSERSVTSEANSVRELTPITQSLALFHFNGCLQNKASFYSGFSQSYFQSSNSVNSLFKQSAIFDRSALQMDNKGIFFNNAGTIEFWASPIMDTYNDPTERYFIDLSAEQIVTATRLSAFIVELPVRARSVRSVTISGNSTNFFDGGYLADDGLTIHLGQAIPANSSPIVSYVPITGQGDRFSILKDETGALTLFVSASGVEYEISVPVYWKKNTWHRVFAGWSLNNKDNQDRLILIVDGAESGIIRYGTGLLYGSGIVYGMPTVWGSATAGTLASRNLLADINMTDFFPTVSIGGDYAGNFPALSRIDNLRFSNQLRPITYLGGSGPGQLIGHDLIYTSNVNTAQPVIEDALTTLLLDFDTSSELVENLAAIHDTSSGIFDFFVEVIDSFKLIPNQDVKDLIEQLIYRIKPAHTRSFVDFGDSNDC